MAGRERRDDGEGAVEARVEVRETDDPRDFAEIVAIRRAVFTDEQHLTDVVDRDPYDHGPAAVQVLARVAGRPVGVGRLHVWRGEGQIAWVAVLPPYRGRGIGWEIMDALLSAAGRLGAQRVTLSAQTHALGFYQLLGFRPVGTTFYMSEIEHITMVRDLG
ncbi:MAG: GNAT family N-acetyltransferase [Chloroflexota bacterium]|nr:GNAT family N-acetyltransferase [Chloroflexota bacterium]